MLYWIKLAVRSWQATLLVATLLVPVNAWAVVFGDDSRTDPICINEAAGELARKVAHFETTDGECSAFLISPRNHVITAAHCLETGWDDNAAFIFNKQAVSCGSSDTFPLIRVPVSLADLVTVDFDLDIALFQLPRDVAIAEGLRWLPLDPDTRLSQLEDEEKLLFLLAWNKSTNRVEITLDEECQIIDVPTTCRHLSEGQGTPPTNACLEHECDSEGGASGGATFTTFNSQVVGMHAGSARDIYLIIGSDEDSYSVKARNFFPKIRDFLPAFLGDGDQDGVPDVADNCPLVANTGTCTAGTVGVIHCLHDRDCDTSFGALDGVCEDSQLDFDFDGVGDLCDSLPPDAFEDNDTPLEPADIAGGFYPSLTLDERFDEDFYLVTVEDDFSFVQISVTRPFGAEIVMEVSDFDTGLAAVGPNEGLSTTNSYRRFDAAQVPAGKRYLVHVFELEAARPIEYDMYVDVGLLLPEDEYEFNNSPATATPWPAGCDFDLTVSPASDVDMYAFSAPANSSVRARAMFDLSFGTIRLFLDDTEATDASPLGDRTQIQISGCAQSPSLIKVQGDMNFYDLCIQRVALLPTCPGYSELFSFAGDGSFEYTRSNPYVPGPPEQVTRSLRKSMSVRIEENTAASVIWSLFGAVDFGAVFQPIHGRLEIARPNPATPVPFGPVSGYPLLRERPGLVAWYQVPPVGSGQGTFEGPDDAITAFDVESTGLQWNATLPDEQGTFTMSAGIDGDRDGIRDDIEATTCTDPTDDDTDDDGLLDGTEDANGNGQVDLLEGETDPCNPDTDGDGVSDGVESGLTGPEGGNTDPGTFQPDADPSTTTDPTRIDTDGDGMTDGEEDANANGAVDEGETSPIVVDLAEPEPEPFSWTDVFGQLFNNSSDLATFREYRDEYLARTEPGQRYVALLYQNSDDALTVLMENPEWVIELHHLIERNKEAVAQILEGKEATIDDTDRIVTFLSAFARRSPPRLRVLLEELTKKIVESQRRDEAFLGFRLR